MGTLTVDYLENTQLSVKIPIKELETRVIQYFRSEYTGGAYTPSGSSYAWVPGTFVDFTPKRSDTRIKYTARIPYEWQSNQHAISHWNFYADGRVYYSWSESGGYIENAKTFEFDVPSWGTSQGRIGIQARNYDGNNGITFYATHYWNGSGSSQNCFGQLFVEEILV